MEEIFSLWTIVYKDIIISNVGALPRASSSRRPHRSSGCKKGRTAEGEARARCAAMVAMASRERERWTRWTRWTPCCAEHRRRRRRRRRRRSLSKTDVGEEMDQGNVALTSSSRPHFVFREITATLDEETAANVSVRVHSASSRVVQHAQYPPLGIIIEPTQYGVEITEVTDTSSPFKEGDIIKAVSGMIPTMKYGQGNLLLGGNGRPGFNRVMCTVRSALRHANEKSTKKG